MLEAAIVYLAAALVSVPIAKKLGLGSVLGYLIAGVIIGPSVLHLVGDQTEVMHVAEFGVVMMLFLVGLELQPKVLWKMRKAIMGLGGLQVTISTLAIFAAVKAFGLSWQASLSIGLMLALSSTAIALQTLNEKGWIKREGGQNSFAVLLFQDIAVIPMLAAMPLLATMPTHAAESHHTTWTEGMPVWGQFGVSLLTIAVLILFGRYGVSPIFRAIASIRLRELFTLFALFLVIAIATLMTKIGLSPALGTFLAGVVLAESEYRHELETDIEPFKGLFLGLFFITVGASINFSLLFEEIALISGLVVGLIAVKGVILMALATIFKLKPRARWLFAFALAQGGEFAFVLLNLTGTLHILTQEQTALVTLVVAVSMFLAPLLLLIYQVIEKRDVTQKPDYDEEIESSDHVIVAGYGRFGQIVARLMQSQGIEVSILDYSPSQIELVRRFGSKVFYGDAARTDLLAAAGAKEAKLLVIAIDDPDKTLEIIHCCKKNFPQLKIAARAYDRRHVYELMRTGVDVFRRETFDSALNLGIDAIELLGFDRKKAEKAAKLFREHDEESIQVLSQHWGDDRSYGIAYRQRNQALEQVLKQEQENH